MQDQLLKVLNHVPHTQAARFITCVCRELNQAKNELAVVMTQGGFDDNGELCEMIECEQVTKVDSIAVQCLTLSHSLSHSLTYSHSMQHICLTILNSVRL